MIRPDPAEEELVRLCDLGPLPADGPQPLSVILHVVKQRDIAARACAERHARLVAWAKRVSATQP